MQGLFLLFLSTWVTLPHDIVFASNTTSYME